MSFSKLPLFFLWSSLSTVVLSRASVDKQIKDLITSDSPLLQYPTQFTQDIVPKQIHSHNDYWRDVPLYTALSYGVGSVEADVWLSGSDLLIGHDPESLTADRTFDSLYLQPLLKILSAQNPDTVYTRAAPPRINGIFDTSSGTSLNLLVDVKTDGASTLPAILQALKPLRDAGYLTTYYSNGTLVPSAITVIGTGNTPLDLVKDLDPRDYFFDGPLANLTGYFEPTLSPIASTDYEVAVGWNGIGTIPDDKLAKLKQLVNDAHALGIQARFWDTPGWPVSARNNVWKVLLENGADWLNADDVKAASEF
ncbi:PLC-like phosphodiesterase [Thelephora terrestris]|uniref:Altered inheritance of mitochondria protein 6 n=1 Tax=Thelephora terrestris TaxID=56493 RepID=A0A9P6L8A9_9AGAM|nr:PLC-like phosphodiesterase [Thelephora terrestris]